MTKAEILERINTNVDLQHNVSKSLFELLKAPSVSADTAAISSVLIAINSTICDTMTTLALILSEMMVEEVKEAPEKAPVPMEGEHYYMCQRGSSRSCLCNSCANDHGSDVHRQACCVEHGFGCNVTKCPDYVEEDRNA